MARQRKAPTNTIAVQFDARIPLQRIAAALKADGILLKTNGETFQLYAVEAPKPRQKEGDAQ